MSSPTVVSTINQGEGQLVRSSQGEEASNQQPSG